MKSVELKAYPRTLVKRNGVKKIYTQGRVPAIIYGRHIKPQNLEVNSKEIEDLVHHSASENILVDLHIEGDQNPKRLVLVKEVQHHPLTRKILHVDFNEVSETEKVTVVVPIETVGEAVGVKTGGGILEHVLHRVKVRCLPKDIPEFITIDVSNLEVGKAIHIGDIQPPQGVEILGEKSVVVVAVAAPITEEQEKAALEAATAPVAADQVEMIKEKKEEAGAEEKAAPAKEKAAEKPAEKAAEKKK
ncbi:MAG: 50S ribosomal protein L25 [Verrucomicrobiae bacterium]|nr:50S ribosomal protein L25 [Verrucomicrobiae bacterium]